MSDLLIHRSRAMFPIESYSFFSLSFFTCTRLFFFFAFGARRKTHLARARLVLLFFFFSAAKAGTMRSTQVSHTRRTHTNYYKPIARYMLHANTTLRRRKRARYTMKKKTTITNKRQHTNVSYVYKNVTRDSRRGYTFEGRASTVRENRRSRSRELRYELPPSFILSIYVCMCMRWLCCLPVLPFTWLASLLRCSLLLLLGSIGTVFLFVRSLSLSQLARERGLFFFFQEPQRLMLPPLSLSISGRGSLLFLSLSLLILWRAGVVI